MDTPTCLAQTPRLCCSDASTRSYGPSDELPVASAGRCLREAILKYVSLRVALAIEYKPFIH